MSLVTSGIREKSLVSLYTIVPRYTITISALGRGDVLTTPAAQDVKVGADNFDDSQVNPETLRRAK